MICSITQVTIINNLTGIKETQIYDTKYLAELCNIDRYSVCPASMLGFAVGNSDLWHCPFTEKECTDISILDWEEFFEKAKEKRL